MAENHTEAARLPKFNFPPDQKKAKILEIIEKIRHCDVEQEINVPELVLCGQQSSGKSSVLEALTGLEFPKGDGGACTRFPIEIRLFSGAETSYILSKVRFCPMLTDVPSGMNNFQELVDISSNDLSDIIHRAKEIMEIPSKRKFSHNVLSIEYHFPDPESPTHAPRLTLIDLPGIVAVEEQDFLDLYTKKYIERKTSLVLAVANGAEDPENLRILKLVNDSNCSNRTFGIITKPDMTYPNSNLETRWVNQVLNPDRKQFGLGSHVVYNRSPTQTQEGDYHMSLDDRDAQEREFFAAETRFPPNVNNDRYKEKITNGWHKVYKMESSDRWGIQNLRNRLVALLSDRASEQVLPIYRGVQEALEKKNHDLAKLEGKDPQQMRKHFENAMYDLRKLANQASSGSYNEQAPPTMHNYRPFFVISQDSCHWLRSKIDKKSKEFYEVMKTRGHNANEYVWKPDVTQPIDPMSKDVDQMLVLLHRTQSGTLPYESGHGILNLVFKSFSEPWYQVASEYLDQCYSCCEEFVRDVVCFVLDDQACAERLLAKEILGRLERRKEAALATLELLDYDRGDAPMSLHPDMWMVAKSNAMRLSDNLKTIKPAKPEPVQSESENLGHGGTDASLQRAELAVVNRMTALKQLDNLMLVYKKCRDTYIDNVVVQVVHRCLLRGFDDLFRHDWMYNNALFDEITKDPNIDANAEKERTLREHIGILKSAKADLEKLLGNYNRD